MTREERARTPWEWRTVRLTSGEMEEPIIKQETRKLEGSHVDGTVPIFMSYTNALL